MRLRLLYFEGCPGFSKTSANLKELIPEEIDYSEVDVNKEEVLHKSFYGSPTVVYEENGRWIDIFGIKGESFIGCRPYKYKGKVTQFIPKELLSTQLKRLSNNIS